MYFYYKVCNKINNKMSIHNTIFKNLPKELIDMIYQFNVDHRLYYSEVIEELLESVPEGGRMCICNECDEWFDENLIGKFYIDTLPPFGKRQLAFCSDRCLSIYRYDFYYMIKKTKRAKAQDKKYIFC